VAEKIKNRLAKHDIFIAIVTPQDDQTWLIQETTAAEMLKKPIFILKQEDASLKSGILGDYEYIQFPVDQISKAFIPILEGLQELKQ
jgi:hypothetical protein